MCLLFNLKRFNTILVAAKGKELREVGQATSGSDYEKVRVVAKSEYKLYVQRLQQWKDEHAKDIGPRAQLMTRNEFLAHSDFPTADPTVTWNRPELKTATLSVLVPAQNDRYGTSNQSLIILEFPVDLKNFPMPELPQSSCLTGGVLISESGRVLYQSNNTLAYRTGFWGEPDNEAGMSGSSGRVSKDDRVHAPIKNAAVMVNNRFDMGATITNERGAFTVSPILPDFYGEFEYTTNLWTTLTSTPTAAVPAPLISL